MSLYDYYDRQIPEYYPTMYLDGYEPHQILHAAHRTMIREYYAREIEKRSQKENEAQLEKDVKIAIDNAMKDLFKEWK